MEDEACGQEFIVDGSNIVGGWPPEIVRKIETVTLVCSRPLNHIPPELHSDGVTDWLGDD